MTGHEHKGGESRCLDADTLVDLDALLDHDPETALEHLRSCEKCLGTLRTLELLRRAHAPQAAAVEREREMAERVVRTLLPEGEAPPAGVRVGPSVPGGGSVGRTRWPAVLAAVVSAALTGFFGALLVGSPGEVGPAAALLAGAATGVLPLLGEGGWLGRSTARGTGSPRVDGSAGGRRPG
ncbi:MAG: hypothetical protein PVI57_11630 [Gemmatimonadota bacterium]|jgi:hypothetical protein